MLILVAYTTLEYTIYFNKPMEYVQLPFARIAQISQSIILIYSVHFAQSFYIYFLQ